MLKKKKIVFLAIYQLKNTSDCIKIDLGGPGRNLKKNKMIQDFLYFSCNKKTCFWVFFWGMP